MKTYKRSADESSRKNLLAIREEGLGHHSRSESHEERVLNYFMRKKKTRIASKKMNVDSFNSF